MLGVFLAKYEEPRIFQTK